MVVGFEQTSYTIDEDGREISVCVAVTRPLDTQPLDRMFTLRVSTRPDTAGMSLKLFLLTI